MNPAIFQVLIAMTPPPAQPGQPAPNPLMSLAPIIFIFVIMYFLLIRPQQKRAKEHSAMLDTLQVGDEIVTSGGIFGRITRVGAKDFTVEVADKVRLRIAKDAVTRKAAAPESQESK